MSASSGFIGEQIEATIELVQVYELTRRAAVGALAWAIYDYVITFSTEVTHVWLRPWNWSKVLFGWTRYVGTTIIIVWATSTLLTPTEASPAISCNLYYYSGAWGGVITQLTLSVIMILRLWAMYQGNKLLAWFLATLLLIHITALCIIFGLGSTLAHFIPPIPYFTLNLNMCFAPKSPSSFIGIWASRLALDTIFFSFALRKAFQQYRRGWHGDIVDMLITDNVAAFALVLIVQVINLVIMLVVEPQAAEAAVGFALAKDVIIGSRLLLHTKEVINKRRSPYETEFGQEPPSAFQANASPKNAGSFLAAVRESYAGSDISSDVLSRPFSDMDAITSSPIRAGEDQEDIARPSPPMPGRFEKLLSILVDPLRWPDNILQKTLNDCKGYFLDFFAPPRSERERKVVESGKAVFDGEEQNVSDDVKQAILFLAMELDVSEYLCAALLGDILEDPTRPAENLAVENAIMRYYSERADCLRCLKSIFEGALNSSYEGTAVASILGDFSLSLLRERPTFTADLLRSVDKGRVSLATQQAALQGIAAPTQPSLGSFQQAGTSARPQQKLGTATLEQRIKFIAKDRRELGHVLFYMASSLALAPMDVLEITRWLKACNAQDELVAYVFSALSAALNVNTTTQFDVNASSLLGDATCSAAISNELKQTWSVPQLRSSVALQWAIFLIHAPTQASPLTSIGTSRQDPERMILDAVHGDAIQYLTNVIITCRPSSFYDEDSLPLPAQPVDSPGMIPPIEPEFHLYALRQLELLVINFLNSVSTAFLRKLRHAEEDADKPNPRLQATRSTRPTPESGEPRRDVAALLSLIAAIYGDSQGNAGLIYWQDPDSKLASFLRWAAETAAPALVRANFDMLASLSKGQNCSLYAYEFLASRSRGSGATSQSAAVVCSWANLFSTLTYYHDELRQTHLNPSTDRHIVDALSRDDSIEFPYLMTTMRLLRIIVRDCPLARATLNSTQLGAANLICSLSFLLPSLDLQGAMWSALSSFCAGSDPGAIETAKLMWTRFETSGIIPYTLSNPAASHSTMSDSLWRSVANVPQIREGLVHALEEVETTNGVYPATVPFTNLLSSMIHVPNNTLSLRPRVVYQTVSETISPERSGRPKGIDAFIRFELDDVFYKIGQRRYRTVDEKWKVIEACLMFVEKCLESYDILGLLTPGVIQDQDSTRTKRVLTTLLVHPGFEILRRLSMDNGLPTIIFEIISEGSVYLDATDSPSPLAERAVKSALRVLHRALDVQPMYLEVLWPILSGTEDSQLRNILRVSGLNMAYNHSPMDQLLLRAPSTVERIAMAVGRIQDEETILLAVKILSLLSDSPVFNAADDSRAGAEGTRLATFLSSSSFSLQIMDAFSLVLAGESPEEEDDVQDLNVVLRQLTNADSGRQSSLVPTIRSAVLDLLLANTVKGRPAPNIAHFLLGFNLNAAGSSESLLDKSRRGVRSCLDVVLDLLFEGFPAAGTVQSSAQQFLVRQPRLAEQCYHLLYNLSVHDWTSAAVMRYLRTEYDFSARQLFHIPERPEPALRASGVVQFDDRTEVPSTCSSVTAFLRGRAWLLDVVALELHLLVEAGQIQRAARLVSVIFGGDLITDDPDVEFIDFDFDAVKLSQHSQLVLELLRSLDIRWHDNLKDSDGSLKFFTAGEVDACLRVDDSGCEVYDADAVVLLVNSIRKRLELQGAFTNPEQRVVFDNDSINLVKRVAIENNRREMQHGKELGLKAWRRMVEVALGPSFELLRQDQREAAILDLLVTIPERIPGVDGALRSPVLSELVLSLVTKLREGQQSNIELDLDDHRSGAGPTTLPNDQVGQVLRNLVDAVLSSGSTDAMRGNLYSAITNCIQLLTTSKSQRRETLLSYFDGRLDRLTAIIARDALGSAYVWQAVAYSLLEILVSVTPSGQLRSLNATLLNYVQQFVQSIKLSEGDLFAALAPDADTLDSLYVYEAKMGLIQAVVRAGACDEALARQVYFTLAECEYIKALPQEDDDAMELDSFLPSLTERYHQLLLPALQLATSVLSTSSRPSSALAQSVLSFLGAQKDVLMILLDSVGSLTLTTLQEVNMLLSLVIGVLPTLKPEDLKQNAPFGAFHLSIMRAIDDSMSEKGQTDIMPSSESERIDEQRRFPLYRKRISVFRQHVQTALSQLHEYSLLYLTNVMELQGFTPVIAPSKSNPALYNLKHRDPLPLLAIALKILKASVSSLGTSVTFVEDLSNTLSSAGQLTDDEVDELLRIAGLEPDAVTDEGEADHLATETLKKSVLWAQNDCIAHLRTVEMLVFLVWRHMDMYINQAPNDQTLKLRITETVSTWDPNEVRSLARRELASVLIQLEDLSLSSGVVGDLIKGSTSYLQILGRKIQETIGDQFGFNNGFAPYQLI
ncbi:hypothetical protein CALVIDRAFT_557980 [Calocera viscosa TUFC12733]|uniref:DUF6533 domain-containing protein n=1 Tax=Calocera viscosa (strain TUFC12733) TaxID=1330018 RepID=A0A167HNJ0_CALVF|nr:hypothetical protein CALVIDRAFT_557980 [Calocera viscosa TUFC12733]